jgi:hypothetical protein
MVDFRVRFFEEYGPKGYKFFSENIWTSSIQQSDLEKVRSFLLKNNFDNVDVAIAMPTDDEAKRIGWNRYYDASGQCISQSQEIPIPKGSNHLKLTFCYASAELRDESKPHIVEVANALRLVFGVPIARELINTNYFSDSGEQQAFSTEGFASIFDTQEINRFDTPPIEDAEIISIPIEAAILLDKSFAQIYPKERYILMWLALETIIQSVVTAGNNGDKRKTYFKVILNSEIANNEVFRLFQLRNSIFKEGRHGNNLEKDCWSLYAAIQLLIMKECDQRKAFLSGYEQILTQGSN